MEILFGVVLVVAVVWASVRWLLGAEQEQPTAGQPAPPQQAASLFDATAPTQVGVSRSGEGNDGEASIEAELRDLKRRSTPVHTPPSPSGSPAGAWSPRTRQLEVAGEWYRIQNLRTLFRRHAELSEEGAEIHLPAVLVPDPENPKDPRAVAVFVDGLHVGYMERGDAKHYHRQIAKLPSGQLTVPSRQWLRETYDNTYARVTLSLPMHDQLLCPNPLDRDAVLLPAGSTVQVTREENHMEHLAAVLDRYGAENVVLATLRCVTEQRPRSTVDLVAVDIDREQVGVLTPTQSANFIPLVRRAEELGTDVACRASLRGNSLKSDVALHARKAHEYDETELTALFASASETNND